MSPKDLNRNQIFKAPKLCGLLQVPDGPFDHRVAHINKPFLRIRLQDACHYSICAQSYDWGCVLPANPAHSSSRCYESYERGLTIDGTDCVSQNHCGCFHNECYLLTPSLNSAPDQLLVSEGEWTPSWLPAQVCGATVARWVEGVRGCHRAVPQAPVLVGPEDAASLRASLALRGRLQAARGDNNGIVAYDLKLLGGQRGSSLVDCSGRPGLRALTVARRSLCNRPSHFPTGSRPSARAQGWDPRHRPAPDEGMHGASQDGLNQ
nr:uncharacterized protein LOC129051822 [Pongo abelii]